MAESWLAKGDVLVRAACFVLGAGAHTGIAHPAGDFTGAHPGDAAPPDRPPGDGKADPPCLSQPRLGDGVGKTHSSTNAGRAIGRRLRGVNPTLRPFATGNGKTRNPKTWTPKLEPDLHLGVFNAMHMPV
jgi:hypothetical protein